MKNLNTKTHVWKHKANATEIPAMSLRKEFDNILGKFSKMNGPPNAVAVEEDAETFCGSTDSGRNNQDVGRGNSRKSDFIDKNRMC